MIDLALVLAAGSGSRLEGGHAVAHKALIPVAGEPLLLRTCRLLEEAGVRRVIVVTGYHGEALRAALSGPTGLRLQVAFAANAQWQRANGLSVLAAADQLTRPYLLSMADHVFEVGIATALCRVALGPDEAVLAVDRKIDTIYDLDDATKVRLEGDRIVAIGKGLDPFDAIDTGLFACSQAVVPALRRRVNRTGDVSLSDGMRELAEAGRLRCHDIGPAWWQDVDTPGALQCARERLERPRPDEATSP